MQIAITNDDGYTEGVEMLLRFAKTLGKAYAIIPSRQRSAVASAITLHKPLRLNHISEDVYALSGTPADCSIFSIYAEEMPTPDVIFSGINWGDNTGMSPLVSSGTIGACWKAAVHSTPSVAFSIYQKDRMGWMKKENWKYPDKINGALGMVWKEIEPQLKRWDLFIVNMPSPERLDDAEIIIAEKIQKIRVYPVWEKRMDPNGTPYFWLGGGDRKVEKGTDYWEVAERGNIVITRVKMEGMFRE